MNEEQIKEDLEKEFGIMTDYFNHRPGYFKLLAEWIMKHTESVREYEHEKIKSQLSPGSSVRRYWTTDEVHEKINQVRKDEKKAAQEYSSLQIRKVIETIQDFETGLLDEDFEGKTLIEILKMKFE